MERAAATVKQVAQRLERRGHQSAEELFVIAQLLTNGYDSLGGDMDRFSDGNLGAGNMEVMDYGFDPSQEPSSTHSFKEEAEDGPEMGLNDDTEEEDGGLHPDIDSFVKAPSGGGRADVVDDRRTHTCTVTFKAPPNISEADMMNYILGIGKHLKVDVDSFKWAKSDIKPGAGAGAGRA